MGAIINSIQIVEAPSIVAALYSNLTAVSFVIGSVLFLVASVPYTWQVNDEDDAYKLYAFLGSLEPLTCTVTFKVKKVNRIQNSRRFMKKGFKTKCDQNRNSQ